VDAREAVAAAATGSIPTPDPAIYLSPQSLSFGAFGTLLNVYLRSSGAPGVQLIETRVSDDWLAVAPTASTVNGFGQYAVSVTRASLVPGPYAGYVEFISNANAVRLPVLMEVSTESRTGDAGLHYVLLVDVNTGEAIAQREVSASGGTYRYRFSGVPPGNYRIMAGSDADNDGLVCDPGEACGAYLTLDQPVAVEVAGDRVGLDFNSGFDVAIRQSSLADGFPSSGVVRRAPADSSTSN
jgi:serine protease